MSTQFVSPQLVAAVFGLSEERRVVKRTVFPARRRPQRRNAKATNNFVLCSSLLIFDSFRVF